MKLVGNYLSPYARRVAISLTVLGLPFELDEVFVMKAPEKVRDLNPVLRIPVLVLNDGDTLFESAVILDAIMPEMDGLETLRELYAQGVVLDWGRIPWTEGRLVDLPTTPFERQSYWLQGRKSGRESRLDSASDMFWRPK